jgi:hypothetical protein
MPPARLMGLPAVAVGCDRSAPQMLHDLSSVVATPLRKNRPSAWMRRPIGRRDPSIGTPQASTRSPSSGRWTLRGRRRNRVESQSERQLRALGYSGRAAVDTAARLSPHQTTKGADQQELPEALSRTRTADPLPRFRVLLAVVRPLQGPVVCLGQVPRRADLPVEGERGCEELLCVVVTTDSDQVCGRAQPRVGV